MAASEVPAGVTSVCAALAPGLGLPALISAVSTLGFGDEDLPEGGAEKLCAELTRARQQEIFEILEDNVDELVDLVAENGDGLDIRGGEGTCEYLRQLAKCVEMRMEDLARELEVRSKTEHRPVVILFCFYSPLSPRLSLPSRNTCWMRRPRVRPKSAWTTS
jgi:hypothetical protein